MVKLTKIYTRAGDKGKTSLGDGSRVAKHALRVEAYGTVDEANAVIGLVRTELNRANGAGGVMDACLGRIQNDLFDLGADLCTPDSSHRHKNALRIVDSQITWIEREIDTINTKLEPLNSFILPGGTPVGAQLHAARTVTRRAERLVSALAETDFVNSAAIRYLNRLSDLLFVLSRTANNDGKSDVLWKPGGNQ